MAKAKKQTTDTTPLTLAEFKAWLNGVSDMQETSWSPNREQWEKIKSQIERIEDYDTKVYRSSPNLNDNIPSVLPSLPVNTQTNNIQNIPTESAFEQLKIKPTYQSLPNKETAGVKVDINNPPLPGTEFV